MGGTGSGGAGTGGSLGAGGAAGAALGRGPGTDAGAAGSSGAGGRADSFVAWIDEIAMDTNRIGCGNLSMVPLVEPIRPLAPTFPGPYPTNIYGETPHSAMGNQITALVRAASPAGDYVTVHTVVGESGQSLTALVKQTGSTTDTIGRAYAASLFEAAAIARLAKTAGKTYGISVIVMTHGENDNGNTAYEAQLVQLLASYNADLLPLTGQTQKIQMFVSQQHSLPNGTTVGARPASTLAQWRLGVDHPGDFVCTGPKYQYPGATDGVHLTSVGYQLLGEKTAEVYNEIVVLGHNWQPLQPTTVSRNGTVVTVNFNVPAPPLVWDTSFNTPAIPEWANGRGFELRTNTARIPIASVAIVGNAVQITAAAALPATGLFVGYALSSQGVQSTVAAKEVRWGELRDSDPFVGSTTHLPNPNYGVSFEIPVP